MRREFRVVILLALSAIPAGVAMVPAPEYIPALKAYPGLFFWGGFVLAAALMGAAIIIALRGEETAPRTGHGRRMIALIGMGIFGAGFLACAAIYFWPTPKSDSRSSAILLAPPAAAYDLTWDAPNSVEVIMLPKRGPNDTTPLKTGLPLFRLKNLGKDVAQEVMVEWKIDESEYSLQRAAHALPRFSGYEMLVSNDHVALFYGHPSDLLIERAKAIKSRGSVYAEGVKGYACGYSSSETSTIAYLAPEINNDVYTDLPMPWSITNFVDMFIVASLPLTPHTGWQKLLTMMATIHWRSSEENLYTKYRIDIEALPLGGWATLGGILQVPPGVKAEVRFTTSRLNG